MRALRLYGPRDVRLEDVNEPEVMNGYVKIKILEATNSKIDLVKITLPQSD